ncbi:MAG: DUF2264 domain-containing protein [Niameybacter sp.]|uniref:DUF2264 domain-containing protein n=1 Tax=Niameybacter sp. TaxID=2033640 RepID=UPI002FCC759A
MNTLKFNTKQDYQESVLALCEPLKKYFFQGKAGLKIGVTEAHYDQRTIALETFSRPLWGLVPFFAGGGKSDFDAFYQEGLKNGPNEVHKEYWGKGSTCHQSFVEMAAIGLGLLLAPEKFWTPLKAEEQKNLNIWLLQINEHVIPSNNWLFFRVFVNIGLRSVGAEYSEEAINESLETVEKFYLGEGWYSDGKSSQRDYYVAFAMHFYSLVYAKKMKDIDPARCETYKERAKLFAQDFIYWFVEGGESLPYGRSLTYRFAQCAFWSALAFADVEVFSWGVMKGIVNRHFRSWFSRPILDAEGKLTIGYGYPNIQMTEGYNSSGSPYWSFKSFLVLALDDHHPFWLAEEEPLPTLDEIRVQKHAMLMIQRISPNHAVALASGQYAGWEPLHTAEKYSKFAYSTYFGFNVPRSYYSLSQAAPDNMLTFMHNHMCFVRRKCEEVVIGEKSIYSKWSPLEGIVVETVLEPCGKGHIRKHTIHSEIECEAFEAGFAIPVLGTSPMTRTCEGASVRLEHGEAYTSITLRKGEGVAESMQCETSCNIIHPKVSLPFIKLTIPKGITEIECYVEGDRI